MHLPSRLLSRCLELMQHWLSCPSGQCCASDIISKWSVSELPAEAPKFGANIGELLRLSASAGQSCKVSSNLIHSLCSSGLRLCSLRSSRRDVRDTDRCTVAVDGLFARPSSTLRSSSMRRCWPQHFEADQNSSTTEAELNAKMLAPLKAPSLR